MGNLSFPALSSSGRRGFSLYRNEAKLYRASSLGGRGSGRLGLLGSQRIPSSPVVRGSGQLGLPGSQHIPSPPRKRGSSTGVGYYKSSIGWLKMVFVQGQLYSLSRISPRGQVVQSGFKSLYVPVGDKVSLSSDRVRLAKYLHKYFLTGVCDSVLRKKIILCKRGTDFQRRVWRELEKIPYGGVRTYSEVARRVSSPRGFRAVGMACGKNPFLLLVPCHRVVAAQGGLGGFALGLRAKRFLLKHENSAPLLHLK